MIDFLQEWLRNLIKGLLITALVCFGMLIFLRIFYPDTISFLFLTGEFAGQLASAFKLWPILILMIFVYALPKRKRRR